MEGEELRKFLDSGMLELYLLGALGTGEVSLVERMRKLHSEIDTELESIEAFLERAAIGNAVSPSARTESKMIFGRLC